MSYATAIPIGRGAMGEVAKAWDPTLGRWVALKFLRHPDPELEARMVREARAQARVEHPNVCRVYEVGERDGRPFIAMQYIEGESLDRAAVSLPLEAKVSLVKKVAEAVHAAHAVGLVHRDLKPGNILVEEDAEGVLQPYVVDFGIAREHSLPDLTMTGQVLGTPGYLSPEQARGEVGGLDRRSDIFSLGVVLYELLSGERPHEGGSSVEVLVNLLGKEPRPLRQVLPQVPRDLESVVMRCLEAEPERRYPSARALAEDLGRFLEGEAVLARPTSLVGRLWKQARRNRLVAGLLAAGALTVIVLGAALVAGWAKYTLDLERERSAALEAQRAAETKELEAREISEFLVGLFEVADPAETSGETVTARQILDRGVANLEVELADQPLTRSAMMTVVGQVYGELGLFDDAERILREALEIRQRELGLDAPEVADTLVSLGGALRAERSFTAAAEVLRRALRIRLGHLGPDHVDVARVKAALASCHREEGDLAQAESLNREALEVLTRELGPDDRTVLNSLAVHASIVQSRGDLESASALYTELLARQERSLGPDAPLVAVTHNNLAYVLMLRRDLAGAERHYRVALDLARRLYGEGHPNTLMVLSNLAGVMNLEGSYEEAERLLRLKVDLERSALPANHWRLGSSLVSGLGRALVERGKYSEAEPVLREGLEILEADLGVDHSWVATARGVLASCLFGLGRNAEAASLVRVSLEHLEGDEPLSKPNWYAVKQIIESLEAVGRPEIAARYRALLTEDRKPQGV